MKSSPKDCHYDIRWLKFFRKWHRWPGLILGIFFILWAMSGIVMNHRELFSGFDISRKYLPEEHRYVNWNNAAVKSAVNIGPDSILVFGNIGIWLTDSSFSSFQDFNTGFPDGIDNRKISSMLVTSRGNTYAGTLFGLYHFDPLRRLWVKLSIPVDDERIQWLVEKGNEVMILTRSELLKAKDDPGKFTAEKLHLPPPGGHDDKAGLFRTIWVIHSGEIYGSFGKLIVDAMGLIVILLAITGVLHFSMPYALRRLKRVKKPTNRAAATKRVSAKWHKKAGIWIAVFLLINTVTGMFLRPPLLITIANARVGKIPFSKLDTPNPWEDKLRAVIYDEEAGGFIFGTTEGLYLADETLKQEMIVLPGQPPLSVMGINVFQKTGHGKYLVGSFNGLYDWMPGYAISRNHFSGEIPGNVNTGSKPFGDEMVSGYLKLENGNEVYFDYNEGAVSMDGKWNIPVMPAEIIEKSPMSWWNFALEVHTGRIFKPLMGDLYILIIPLFGIFGTILVITGIIVWIKLYARKNR
jgi:hypothetical protein